MLIQTSLLSFYPVQFDKGWWIFLEFSCKGLYLSVGKEEEGNRWPTCSRTLLPTKEKRGGEGAATRRLGNRSLRASSPGCLAGKGRRASNYVSGILIPPPIPLWFPVDKAARFPPISAMRKRALNIKNIKKHVKARAKGIDVITNVSSANSFFASTFSMQIFKFHRRSCRLSFLFPPRRQSAPESLLVG